MKKGQTLEQSHIGGDKKRLFTGKGDQRSFQRGGGRGSGDRFCRKKPRAQRLEFTVSGEQKGGSKKQISPSQPQKKRKGVKRSHKRMRRKNSKKKEEGKRGGEKSKVRGLPLRGLLRNGKRKMKGVKPDQKGVGP